MLTLSLQQCINAQNALAALGRADLPIALGIRIASLRFAVGVHADAANEAYQQNLESRAARDDSGAPVITRNEAGALVFDLTPGAQYAAAKEFAAACKTTVELDVVPLRPAEFPQTVRGDELAIAPEVFSALGPLFVA